jgi:hypothetical protein
MYEENESQWTNWSGSVTTLPDLFYQPTSVRAVQDIVTQNHGRTIRCFGTGHSWTPLCVSNGEILIDPNGITDNGQKAFRWQKNGLNLVTFFPSARWADVREALTKDDPLPKMYLPTAGVLPSINATGFVAAGCHGTGWSQPTVSDLVYAVEFVSADGKVHVFSEDTTPNDMNTVRVNLGMLGVITKLTLRVDPMYKLWDQERIVATADVMGRNPDTMGDEVDASKLHALVTGNEYVELFWFPGSGFDGSIWLKQFNRTQEDYRNIPARTDDDWIDSMADGVLQWSAQRPLVIPLVQQAAWSTVSGRVKAIEANKGYVADAPRVLHYQLKAFPILDLEIAVPIPAVGPNQWDFSNVVRAWWTSVNYCRGKWNASKYPVTTCLHARFTNNSQSLLSPAYEPAGSNTRYCWIEIISAYPKVDPNPNNRSAAMAEYDEMANRVCGYWINDLKGRPHWSKYWHKVTPPVDMPSLFPASNLSTFNSLRRSLDPQNMFVNPFLKSRVLSGAGVLV